MLMHMQLFSFLFQMLVFLHAPKYLSSKVTLKLLLFLCILECMGEMINAYRIEAGNSEDITCETKT